jgi:D-amino-acid dehydrogenase
MKIAVIGAGIVGMCTAYELALDGHAVSVFERNGAVAEEASFACAGHLSGSLSHPMAFPAWPTGSRLRDLLAPSHITLGRRLSLRELRWLIRWKAAADGFPERFASAQMLATYSLQRLHTVTAQAALVYEQSEGQLLLFKTESEQLAYQERFKLLNESGAGAKALTPEQARALEPALAADLLFHSAVYLPNDEVANCRQFAHLLKDKLVEAGATLHFGTPVTRISHQAGIQVHTPEQGPHAFDHVVICAGTGAAVLMDHGLGPLAATKVWSHSVSAQIREPLNAPRSAVLDAHAQVSISRMGARIRVSGGAELGRGDGAITEKSTRQLFQVLQSHFPGAADFSRNMQIWKGASIFSPDALPLIGPGGSPGVWLNVAHGHNGWSMACGAARVLADLIGNKQADIDASRFNPGRFKS